ncbi:MFS transporter [Nocardia sp. NPDC127579]|uniref:MFS transporter n=1 Tax=Nocardia sp. NPDC127579 TaxID=3345402 RepID=UPI00364442FE
MLFKGSRDLLPLYALYALLFAEHGLNTAQISSLLAMWSLTAFVLEVPSGAWADTVSRRMLLVLSAALMALGFIIWTVAPSYLGFALGFVLWGAAGALESGTFQALLYDELVTRGARSAYPRIMGYARAAQEISVVVAIMAAAPLYAWGGYALVGWSSVAVAVLHTGIACTLPRAPVAVSAGAVAELEEQLAESDTPSAEPAETPVRDSVVAAAGPLDGSARPAGSAALGIADADVRGGVGRTARDERALFTRYLSMLRTGIAEAVRVRRVRFGVLLASLLYGITSFDEYFALLAQSAGAATAVVAVLVGVTVLGSMAGALLAGRTEGMSARTMTVALALASLLFIAGSLVAGLAFDRPAAVYALTGLGFIAIGVAYGTVYNSGVVAEARLQDSIEGPARATVTSVSGLLSEIVALAVFGFVAVATVWLSMAVTLALLGLVILAIAVLVPAWLPRES